MLPWREMLRTAAMLGLTPQHFWALSLQEWRWLTAEGAPGLGTADLNGLVQKYPDTEDAEIGKI
jgi:hypothetical protein